MAEAIAKQLIAKQRGLAVDELERDGVRVASAGVYAAPGMPASPEAVAHMKQVGIDLSGHRSQPLTPDMIREADALYCMTHAHRQAILQMDPSAQSKTWLLDPGGEVGDPIGSGLESYQRCAQQIRDGLTVRLKELSP